MELILKILKLQKCNIPTYRAQRVDEKSGVICLVAIMFTPGFMVIKISKMAHICIF